MEQGTVIGEELIADGYHRDSYGQEIDPAARYLWEGIKWCGPDRLWRVELPRPENGVEPKKIEHNG